MASLTASERRHRRLLQKQREQRLLQEQKDREEFVRQKQKQGGYLGVPIISMAEVVPTRPRSFDVSPSHDTATRMSTKHIGIRDASSWADTDEDKKRGAIE